MRQFSFFFFPFVFHLQGPNHSSSCFLFSVFKMYSTVFLGSIYWSQANTKSLPWAAQLCWSETASSDCPDPAGRRWAPSGWQACLPCLLTATFPTTQCGWRAASRTATAGLPAAQPGENDTMWTGEHTHTNTHTHWKYLEAHGISRSNAWNIFFTNVTNFHDALVQSHSKKGISYGFGIVLKMILLTCCSVTNMISNPSLTIEKYI